MQNNEQISSSASSLPPAQGLYDPAYEKDACGVGFVAHIKGKSSRDIIDKGIRLMCNLEHVECFDC